ncbi:amino acid permease [Calidifontibacillus erzurumensis]|uniref:Amino acid permease n=1 Tax=Calidifontibacillus erzurumensis TaxID=2741433 RepID=A0A8J8GHH0_9BACI|nr:amino acid permease [Calidifontibacillus erzurumensis]NSL52488.1 amino acid permease [Calidifontibacillus erzurumensis]
MKSGLSTWQLTMLALGTVVGGSFFLGSAVAIRSAGPAVIISYILGGILVYFILFALSEMTVADPAHGSFRVYAEKAFGPGLGFVVGWVYWTGMVFAMSSEAIAVSILLQQWFPALSVTLAGTFIIILVTLINLLGAERLSKIESSLATVKILAIIAFVIIGIIFIAGFMTDIPHAGAQMFTFDSFFAGGIGGIAGSMLIVMFTFAGFEIIGLAASETKDPEKTVPKAIRYTVVSLVSLYLAGIITLLFLIPVNLVVEDSSPMVTALNLHGLGWAGDVMNIVLVTAILSTMLAAVFGLSRMIQSLADRGFAPVWIKGNNPTRAILFSGVAMLLGLGMGMFLPEQVYVFLIGSGGFSILFTYAVIVAVHWKFRKLYGCPPKGRCQFPGYPFASWIVLAALIAIIVSMPLIPGQGEGLAAGILLLVFYGAVYMVLKIRGMTTIEQPSKVIDQPIPTFGFETAEEPYFSKDVKKKKE